MEEWIPIGYLVSAALFIFGLKKLGHPEPHHAVISTEPWECWWLF